MINSFFNISPIWQALIAGLFTWGITALGASIVFFFKKVNKSVMDGLLGFAAGVMIAASFFSLIAPGAEIAEELGMIVWLVVAIGFLSGGLVIFIGDKLFELFCKSKDIEHSPTKRRCFSLITSVTLHNIPEGLVIGVAFGSLTYGFEGASIVTALLLALGIGIQNFPEGSAISLPLRREGYSRVKAFFYGQISGFVEPVSAFIGALLVLKIQVLLPFLLAGAAGAMIYVVVSELIPESQTNKNKNLMALFTLVGFSIMMILDIALG